MQQIIRQLENCEKKLNEQYDEMKPTQQEVTELSVALKKVVTAIDCLDSYNEKTN